LLLHHTIGWFYASTVEIEEFPLKPFPFLWIWGTRRLFLSKVSKLLYVVVLFGKSKVAFLFEVLNFDD